ncbi:MAG: hypothetical protein DHS20C15_11140 [Planctomycetota bacterium]|nr:MAG: hypothetical protein DHS20C15_11140 [Planctomycetota bacterium]
MVPDRAGQHPPVEFSFGYQRVKIVLPDGDRLTRQIDCQSNLNANLSVRASERDTKRHPAATAEQIHERDWGRTSSERLRGLSPQKALVCHLVARD